MREENLALVKTGFEAFGKGDLDYVRGMIADDGVWRTPAYEPFLPEYKGPDGVIKYFTALAELSGGTFKIEPTAFYADDERVVVLDHVTGSRLDKMLDTDMVHVFRVRDGKMVEVTTFASDPKRNEEFWS